MHKRRRKRRHYCRLNADYAAKVSPVRRIRFYIKIATDAGTSSASSSLSPGLRHRKVKTKLGPKFNSENDNDESVKDHSHNCRHHSSRRFVCCVLSCRLTHRDLRLLHVQVINPTNSERLKCCPVLLWTGKRRHRPLTSSSLSESNAGSDDGKDAPTDGREFRAESPSTFAFRNYARSGDCDETHNYEKEMVGGDVNGNGRTITEVRDFRGSADNDHNKATDEKIIKEVEKGDPQLVDEQNRFVETTITNQRPPNDSHKPETSTELQEITGNGVLPHRTPSDLNSNNNSIAANRTDVIAIESSLPVTNDSASATKKLSNGGGPPAEKKLTAKQQQQQQKHGSHRLFQKTSQRSTELQEPSADFSAAAADIQESRDLNERSPFGDDYDDDETPATAAVGQPQSKESQAVEEDSSYNLRCVDALSVMVQHLAFSMDALNCENIKAENFRIKNNLSRTLKLLDDAKNSCTELQDQLCDKEAYFVQREQELQSLHRFELEKAQANLMYAKKQIADLESQLAIKDEEQKRTLDSYRLEMENKLYQKSQHLSAAEERERALQARLEAVERSDQELRDKIADAESSFAERLHLAVKRENALEERLKVATEELNELRLTKENRERELRDQLNLSQDEIAVLRISQNSLNGSMEPNVSRYSNASMRNSSASSVASVEISHLQSETESLRCVLELKQKEISKLSKRNEELMRDAEERSVMMGKISMLEASNELLKSENNIKSNKERENIVQICDLQKALSCEREKRDKAMLNYETLMYQYRLRCEQLRLVEKRLQQPDIRRSVDVPTILANIDTSPNYVVDRHLMDNSALSQSAISGFIEKPASVAWVLEIDQESPAEAASKILRRANSFRASDRNLSRPFCSLGLNASDHISKKSTGNGDGPNPLSQSLSASTVLNPHSKDLNGDFGNRTLPKLRSHSMVAPDLLMTAQQQQPHKIMRQCSTGSARKHDLTPVWRKPLGCSSPYSEMRPRTSTMISASSAPNSVEPNDDVLFDCAETSRKLITCDTSSLNNGEPLERHSLPSHPSVHDLKKAKSKSLQIKESAGEAMVSGANSEDESCSACSDEIASSASMESAATNSTTSLDRSKEAGNLSYDDALLLDKMDSLNGTPMEVSWSEDHDGYTNGGPV